MVSGAIKPRVIPKHDDSNGWWETLPEAVAPNVLQGSLRVQTAIIGAGICGLACAHQLAKNCPNDQIALIDAERAGFGASGRNAGFMLNLHSHGPPKKLKILRRNMKLWKSGLSDLRRMVEEFQIACDWDEYGRLYGSAGPDGETHIDEIAQTLEQLELPYSWLNNEAMEKRIGTGFYHRGLHTTGSALVNPAALMRGLARNLPVNVALCENTPVTSLERMQGGFELETPNGTVTADRIVMAAGVFMKQFGIAAGRFVPMATYASMTPALRADQLAHLGTAAPFGLLGGSEYGATIRLTNDKRLFVRNVFKHAPGAPTQSASVQNISNMHRHAMLKRWPGLSEVEFEHSWGGIMAFTRNDGTVFGEMEKGIYAVLTNDVSPMTRGAAAGRLLADLIVGHDSALLQTQLGIHGASKLPSRPFLDIGIALHKAKLHLAARREF